jgi:SagB-type dehydrogenase family enzyme
MRPIDRPPLANEVTSYVSILATNQDCVAPGVAVREVRPPLTDLSPLPGNVPVVESPPPREKTPGEPLRKILLTRQATTQFGARPVPRDAFQSMNRLAFRGGTFYPLHPDGPHVALVRPFWLIHNVTGMDAGIWYYHPVGDVWSILRHGDVRREAAYLAMEQPAFGRCAATCFLLANLQSLMPVGGPDIYRLAHLESGIVTNRMALTVEALDMTWTESGSFYDDDVRQFLGLQATGWEILNVIGIGTHPQPGERASDAQPSANG